MARLNEAASAAPMESVELLKRRFLRQNKEIIRANSDQSIRIRTLEAEQSRLLSENITLRQENIRLNHELEKGRHALALENVGNVRHKLEIFAAGLGGLLADLAEASTQLPEPEPLHSGARRRSSKPSPTQRTKPGANLGMLAGDDSRLTPIVEGKHYPRKTLDPEELGAVQERQFSMSDSPDLGPPPIVQYDMGDPVKQSPSPSRTKDISPENRGDPQDLFVNLETRKKRRSSMLAKDTDKSKSNESSSMETSQLDGTNEDVDPEKAMRTVKIGGKRKMNMREENEACGPGEDFEYSKRQHSSEDKQPAVLPIRGGRPGQTLNHKKSTEILNSKHKRLGPVTATAPIRRALGEKPVNTDPLVSEIKVRSRSGKNHNGDPAKSDPIKADPVKSDPPSRPRSVSSNRGKPEVAPKTQRPESKAGEQVEQIVPDSLEPATPAVADILSPMDASAPSTLDGPMSRDTPPPSDLGGRGSRRSRPAVSYAEPKLNAKMRRPGKEMVDAVPDDKSKRSSLLSTSIGSGSEPHSTTTNRLTSWDSIKSEASSPLAPKQGLPVEQLRELKVDKKRRPSGPPEDTRTIEERNAALESKIAAVVSLSSRRISRARDIAESREAAAQNAKAKGANGSDHNVEQDVYDFVNSSSPEASLANNNLPHKTHRRVSSVPEKLAKSGPEQGSSGRSSSSSRRRETMATNASKREAGEDDGQESHTEEATDASSKDGGAAGNRLTRRRSMMV